MKLRQSEAFGMLNDNHACFRNIDPDLDHGCRDQKLRRAVAERLHGGVTLRCFHLAMRQCHIHFGKGTGEGLLTVLRGSDIKLFRFLDQRADPVGALAAGNGSAQPADYIAKPVERQRPCVDRKPACRLFVET